jgi:C_GCAxxG_C_C family probable redox protein
MANPSETAADLFHRSFNCSQAVFSAFGPRFGLDEKICLRLASPFGGGVARRGEVCGAVSGALLALGLVRGADDPAGKDAAYQLAGEFLRRFESKHGSLRCRDLIECDLSTPAGYQAAAEKKVFVTICPALVLAATGIVEELLAAPE